jgi:hypothetical protein
MIRVVFIACRLVLGAVFLLACVHKIVDPQTFARAIENYQLVPGPLVNGLAITLPWIEFVLALALWFVPGFRKPAAALMGLMLMVFTGAMIVNIARGLEIACGCFTARGDPLGWDNVVRNLSTLFVAGVVWGEDRLRRRFGMHGSQAGGV